MQRSRATLCLAPTHAGPACSCAHCSPAHLLFCSPGRVWEFIETGKLATDQIKFFILDEAGETIDMVWLCFASRVAACTGILSTASSCLVLPRLLTALCMLPLAPRWPLCCPALPCRPAAGHWEPGAHTEDVQAVPKGGGRRGAAAGGPGACQT
jgi:hypothetical protein